jgi:hypothetical protein
MKRLILAVGCAFVVGGPVGAQQCLHGPNETPEEQARRKQALSVARVVNTIQANQPGAREKRYLRHEELASFLPAPLPDWMKSLNFTPGAEVLPGWDLQLETTSDGYWFMVQDKTDRCRFAFISNTRGVIYAAEPVR